MLFYRTYRRKNPLKHQAYHSGEVGQLQKDAYFTGIRIGASLVGLFCIITILYLCYI